MSELNETEIRALHEALDDEYRAWATYDQVIADFGEVPPFSNIREAEARHIQALCTLFGRYRLPLPENPWPGRVERYANVQTACEAAVAAEIANGEMYERLFGATQRPDILTVLGNLQEASQQRHLPAFQRCAQRRASGGHGARQRGDDQQHGSERKFHRFQRGRGAPINADLVRDKQSFDGRVEEAAPYAQRFDSERKVVKPLIFRHPG